MAVRRDKDTGETIDEPTRKLDTGAQEPATGSPGEGPTEPRGRHGADEASDPPVQPGGPGGGAPAPGSGESPFDAPTQKIGTAQRVAGDGEQTRLLRPGSGAPDAGGGSPGEDAMADPVVGWLVVTAGPGKGRVCPLGYGSNSLGRGGGSRVRLDFGDDRISREGHATLTYDSRGRKFYLQHGGGKNLTYLGDEPVLVPAALEAMQEFSIGGTILRFVPFCGPDFDWRDADTG